MGWIQGALSCHAQFPGRHVIEVQKGSFLPRSRDILTRKFYDSQCTHMLCVDSDIGWHASDVQKLIDAKRPLVSGIYCKKNAGRDLPFSFTGAIDGELKSCNWAPGGFLLIERAVIERMIGAYVWMQYSDDALGKLWALWSMMFSSSEPYSSEDVGFCKRWTALGGEIWAHSGVVLNHYGEACFRPNEP